MLDRRKLTALTSLNVEGRSDGNLAINIGSIKSPNIGIRQTEKSKQIERGKETEEKRN